MADLRVARRRRFFARAGLGQEFHATTKIIKSSLSQGF
jgi:hypothetical protein